MKRLLIAAVLAVLIGGAVPGFAAGQAGGAVLHVRTADGRSTYYIGERIPLLLDFTAPDNKQYEITMASYDRSGRMMHESFEVQPKSGWADPLEDYFAHIGGFMGGGLSSLEVLSPKPITIPLNLNEWVRVDRPGTYRVTVISHRVSRAAGRREPEGDASGLRSEPIELRFVQAPPDWQRAKLNSILAELRAEPMAKNGIPSEKRKAALADLRFLATPAGVHAMAARLRDEEQDAEWAAALGLAGLPPRLRPIALGALDKEIADPQFPVSNWFITLIPLLEHGDSSDAKPQAGEDDAGFAERRIDERRQWANEAWHRIFEALPDKRGKARAATAETLTQGMWSKPSSEERSAVTRMLASALPDLPIDEQLLALERDEDLASSPEAIPIYRRIARLPSDFRAHNIAAGDTQSMRAAALSRWYRTDPEGAHAEVMRQIGTEHPALAAESLSFLSKERLPEFETMWGNALAGGNDYTNEGALLKLMVRFGSGSEVALVRELADANVGTWACDLQEAALGYLVKFDPVTAAPLVARAIRERGPGKTGCYRTTFDGITRYATDPSLEPLAIEELQDPDPEVALDALRYLMGYGDAAAEEPVLRRYEEWNDTWKGREEELQSRMAGSFVGNWQQIALGQTLMQTLLTGQGWIADRELIAQVQERCTTKDLCDQTKGWINQMGGEPFVINVNEFGSDNKVYRVAWYDVKSMTLLDAKIAQFPRGTKFFVEASGQDNAVRHALESQARALIEKNKMVLVQRPVEAAAARE